MGLMIKRDETRTLRVKNDSRLAQGIFITCSCDDARYRTHVDPLPIDLERRLEGAKLLTVKDSSITDVGAEFKLAGPEKNAQEHVVVMSFGAHREQSAWCKHALRALGEVMGSEVRVVATGKMVQVDSRLWVMTY